MALPTSLRDSPQGPTLRPRRSSFLSKVVEPDKLRSPLKLTSGNTVTSGIAGGGGGGGKSGRGGLFPPSPEMELLPPPLPPCSSSSRSNGVKTSTGKNQVGLKKFANSLSGAFSGDDGVTMGKIKAGVGGGVGGGAVRRAAKAGFDLSDWNYDLAAIASHPTSSTSSPNRITSGSRVGGGKPSLTIIEMENKMYGQEDLVTPTMADFPRDVKIPRGEVYQTALAGSTTMGLGLMGGETRRRKSDEMEEGDRPDFMGNAIPVRRDHSTTATTTTGLRSSHSLAHAHMLRSSRTLSVHAALADAPRHPVVASSAIVAPAPPASPFAASSSPSASSSRDTRFGGQSATTTFMNPFTAPFVTRPLSPHLEPSSTTLSTHRPPNKKQTLHSPEQRREEEIFSNGNDEAIFGRPGLSSLSNSVGPGKKPGRTKSLNRSMGGGGGRPLFSPPILPASNSHPGWVGDGFDTVARGVGSVSGGAGGSELMMIKGRNKISSISGLDTLLESGPAVDHFSLPRRESMTRDRFGLGGNEEVMTPPRRRSGEGEFNLLGSKVGFARRGSAVEEGCSPGFGPMGGQRRSMTDMDSSMEMEQDEVIIYSDDEGSVDEVQMQSTPMGGRSRRLSNLHFVDLPSPSSAAPYAPSTLPDHLPFPSRRAASLDSLFLSSIRQGPHPSPFNRAGSITTPGGSREFVNPSVHNLRDHPLGGNGVAGRKRNANGALLVGAGATSNLAASTPLVALSSSPAPWNARETRGEMDEEEEDDMMDQGGDSNWDLGHSPPPPGLTDGGTTSASSSLSTSLSSHAEVDGTVGVHDQSNDSISVLSASGSNGALGTSTNGRFFTPQNYKHVRPLQAAFMSAGLVSKRSRARNDSGIGLGLVPPFRATHFAQETNEGVALVREEEGAMGETVNVLRLSGNSSIMPDTPVKKNGSFSLASSSSATAINLPTTTTSLVTNLAATGTQDDALANGSPLPTIKTVLPTTTTSTSSASPDSASSSQPGSSTRSRGSSFAAGDVSPTVHASRSETRSTTTTTGFGGVRKRPLFRRRSSGQLSSCEGGLLGVKGLIGASGSSESSSGSTVLEMEPMTPTKSVGANWSEGTFLPPPSSFLC